MAANILREAVARWLQMKIKNSKVIRRSRFGKTKT